MRRHVLLVVGSLLVGGLIAPASPAGAEDSPARSPRSGGANGRIALTEPDPRVPTRVAANQVWTANPDGSDLQRQFAAIDEENAFPAWSPDAQWIAFSRDHTLLVARADGSEARELASGVGAYVTWSPDGTRLAYSVRNGGLGGSIWVVNADGSDLHEIRRGAGVDEPAWSPDGTTIAFQMRFPGSVSDTNLGIFVMDVDGGNARALTTDVGDPAYAGILKDLSPSWSPDGTRLAFVSDRDKADPLCMNCSAYDVYVMDADGSDITRIPREGNEFRPVWSPDGGSLAYVAMPVPPSTDPSYVDVRDLAGGTTHHVAPVTLLGAASWGAAPGTMPTADLAASLASSAAYQETTGTVTYVAGLTNAGPGLAASAGLELRLPPGASYDGSTPGCTGATVVRCVLGDVPSGAVRSVSVSATGGVAGVYQPSVLATSTIADPDISNNRATVGLAVCSQLGDTGSDTLHGTGGPDVLCGGGGNDKLLGGGGNDVLLGGTGNDRIVGAKGKDTVSFAASSRGVRVDLGTGRARGDGKDLIEGVENATGSPLADRLTGSSGKNALSGLGGKDRLFGGDGTDNLSGGAADDRIDPGAGDDAMDGGAGSDVVDYGAAARRVKVDLAAHEAKAEGTDELFSIEGARGSRFGDVLKGSVVGNRLLGGGGDDRVLAAGGNDKVTGGAGADRLTGGDGDDRFAGGSGQDRCVQDYGTGRAAQCERTK